jgi:pyridoxal phosphate enzyme (YggS family)
VIDAAALRARLADVRARIARAAGRAGRDPASIRLIAVSKTFPAEYVRAAAEAGQIDFGENKVQEALGKMDQTADLALRWHLIGHLQSNKAKRAVRFDLVHSIDGAPLLNKLDEAAAAAGRRLDLLVQVDLAGEATKHGATQQELGSVFAAARSMRSCRCVGLMILPPAVDDPNDARPYFRALRDLREQMLARGVDASMLQELSMGMSHDFEVAVEEGATLVRVGSAIFGGRTYAQPGLSPQQATSDKAERENDQL